ncbi:Asp-tRNA(Asn)/Glu-tRNA(Gln) amidotransferase GatCAB subunit A [bacterium]|nr:Asp-tRNA(Asn)/Glu-tRNA(Gln) amidotransferase GatCAB subunit A [bacterium]
MTVKEYVQKIQSKELSVEEGVLLFTKNIEEKNKELNAFIEIFDCKDQVKKVQERVDKGEVLPLAGVSVAVKDNILIKGEKCSAGSKILEGYTATYDATVIEKLRDAGAIFVGRTNMDEFAMGSATETSYAGPAKNPHDTDRVPGGSSGGSIVSVAGDMAPLALGSETGGSIRQPASFCGVVGLKPTYGAVSRYGLIAMASSLDQIGPVGKTVEDVEILFDHIKGKDESDSTSKEYPETKQEDVKKIAYPKGFLEEGIDKDVLENFYKGIEVLKKEGYEVEEVEIPYLNNALALYYIIMPAEASSNLARFDGVRYGLKNDTGDSVQDFFETRGEGFGKEVRRRIMLGTYVLSSGYYDAYYKKAFDVQKAMRKGFQEVFKKYDAIVMPVAPTPAFKIGEKSNDPLQMYLSDIFTVSANLVGIPGISVPNGTVEREGKDLPVGFQILAPHFKENRLFALGKKIERV